MHLYLSFHLCPTPRKLLDPYFCSRISFMILKIGGILKSCSFYFTGVFVKCIHYFKSILSYIIIIVYGILCYLRTSHKNTYWTLCMLPFMPPIFPIFTLLLPVSPSYSLQQSPYYKWLHYCYTYIEGCSVRSLPPSIKWFRLLSLCMYRYIILCICMWSGDHV